MACQRRPSSSTATRSAGHARSTTPRTPSNRGGRYWAVHPLIPAARNNRAARRSSSEAASGSSSSSSWSRARISPDPQRPRRHQAAAHACTCGADTRCSVIAASSASRNRFRATTPARSHSVRATVVTRTPSTSLTSSAGSQVVDLIRTPLIRWRVRRCETTSSTGRARRGRPWRRPAEVCEVEPPATQARAAQRRTSAPSIVPCDLPRCRHARGRSAQTTDPVRRPRRVMTR